MLREKEQKARPRRKVDIVLLVKAQISFLDVHCGNEGTCHHSYRVFMLLNLD